MRIPFLPKPAKYLTVCGDAVGYPAPLNFFLRLEFLTAAAAVTLATATDKEDRLRFDALAGGAVAVLTGQFLRKKIDTMLPDLVIDTDPSDSAKTASAGRREHMRRLFTITTAQTIADVSLGSAWMAVSSAIPDTYPANPVYMIPAALFAAAPIPGTMAFISWKVMKSDWAITTRPPQKKEEKKEEKIETPDSPALPQPI